MCCSRACRLGVGVWSEGWGLQWSIHAGAAVGHTCWGCSGASLYPDSAKLLTRDMETYIISKIKP